MNFNNFRKLALIPWLSIPTVLVSYVLLWNRIPPEVVVQFTYSGNPVSSFTREQSLLFNLVSLLVVLSICTWRIRSRSDNSKRLIVRYYFAIATMTIIFLGILFHNINRSEQIARVMPTLHCEYASDQVVHHAPLSNHRVMLTQ